MLSGSPVASPDSSDNSDTQHSGGSDMEMDDQMMSGSKRSQQRLSDTEVNSHATTHPVCLHCGTFFCCPSFDDQSSPILLLLQRPSSLKPCFRIRTLVFFSVIARNLEQDTYDIDHRIYDRILFSDTTEFIKQ